MRTPEQVWEQAARNIALKIYRLAHQPHARLAPIPPTALPWRDRVPIDRAAAALAGLGFRDFGCLRVEAGAGEASDGLRYRLLTTPDGGIRAMLAVVRAQRQSGRLLHLWLVLRGRWPKARLFIEFTTTLDNGSVIDTSNSGQRNPFTSPPDCDTLHMPSDTALSVQLATHRRRVADALARNAGSRVVNVTDLATYERVRDDERERRNRYRQSIDYVTDEELRALAKEHYAQIRDGVRAELARLHENGGRVAV
jgi:hypothetical protein